ncbi:MAG: DUF4282 domain-containing protein [Propionibacteriaceae bacterium]|nr:DUF4282 domain-containing protein [Propionibacteriaceae bacterium]
MSNPPFPHDPQNPYSNQPIGDGWEQSQPTGNVWDQPANAAYAQQAPPPLSGASYESSSYSPQPRAASVFGALFDFGFTTSVTPRLIRGIYLIATIAIGLGLLAHLVVAIATGNSVLIVFAILVGPIVALAALALTRMLLEATRAITRLSEHVEQQLR